MRESEPNDLRVLVLTPGGRDGPLVEKTLREVDIACRICPDLLSLRLEMQEGAVKPGDTVVIVDDLLATGGTMAAAIHLLQLNKAKVAACAFLIELSFLNGRAKLGVPVTSLMQYDS